MAKPTAQQCHALTTYFVNAVTEATGKKPIVNRNKARWGFESILMDYSPTEARELIDYYVSKYDTPTIDSFLFGYEKIAQAKVDKEEESERTQRRREETQRRLDEWRNRWKK